MKGNYTMPKINPISALPIRKVAKSSTKQRMLLIKCMLILVMKNKASLSMETNLLK